MKTQLKHIPAQVEASSQQWLDEASRLDVFGSEGDRNRLAAIGEEMYNEALNLLHLWHTEGLIPGQTLALATQLLFRLIRFQRRDIRPLLALAWVFQALDDQDQASVFIQRAHAIDPEHPLLLRYLNASKPALMPLNANLAELEVLVSASVNEAVPMINGSSKAQNWLLQKIGILEGLRHQIAAREGFPQQLERELLHRLVRFQSLLEHSQQVQLLERQLNEEYFLVSQLLLELSQLGEDATRSLCLDQFSQHQNTQRRIEIQLALLEASGLEVRHLWSLLRDLAAQLQACADCLCGPLG